MSPANIDLYFSVRTDNIATVNPTDCPPGYKLHAHRSSVRALNHSCRYIFVTEQFLNGSDVIPVLQQVCRKGMPQCMAGCRFGYTRFQSSVSEPTLKNSFMKMMSTLLARDPVDVTPTLGISPPSITASAWFFGPGVCVLLIMTISKRYPT